eukprot:765852-Hanusia_phi.AAC.10
MRPHYPYPLLSTPPHAPHVLVQSPPLNPPIKHRVGVDQIRWPHRLVGGVSGWGLCVDTGGLKQLKHALGEVASLTRWGWGQ